MYDHIHFITGSECDSIDLWTESGDTEKKTCEYGLDNRNLFTVAFNAFRINDILLTIRRFINYKVFKTQDSDSKVDDTS